MKKYKLQPTRENLIKTLCNDTLNRNKDLVYFYKILTNQEQYCTGFSYDNGKLDSELL